MLLCDLILLCVASFVRFSTDLVILLLDFAAPLSDDCVVGFLRQLLIAFDLFALFCPPSVSLRKDQCS